MECEEILHIQQKLQRLYDVLSSTVPVTDLGIHPFTLNAKKIRRIITFIEGITEEALAEKRFQEEKNLEIMERISKYSNELQLPTPVIEDKENVMLQEMELESELSRIMTVRSGIESEINALVAEICKVNEWLGRPAVDGENTKISLENMNYLRGQLSLLVEEKTVKEAKRQDYYDELERSNKILRIKSVFTLDESIGALEEMVGNARAAIQNGNEQYAGLLADIKKGAEYLGIEPEQFSDSIDAENLGMMREYSRGLREERARLFDSIFDKTKSELMEINKVFGIKTIDYSVTEESLDTMREAIASLLPKKDLFCEIFSLIEKRQLLLQKMTEFEKIASDPKRLFRSSFQLNTEEKFRNTAYPSLLKLEDKLFELIEAYEESFGKFSISDQEYKVILRAEVDNRIINRTVFISRCDSPYRKKR
ncbi:hypothetical protein PAEPH01_1523 [Pancytospora epiphaga]|nr:hypothetical protein PAEPH01_1523 [Pancytospora epiphaga]